MNIKYIIFDMDGTLINTEEKIHSIIISEVNKCYPEISQENILKCIEDHDGEGIESVISKMCPNADYEMVEKISKSIYNRELNSDDLGYDFFMGVIPLIKKLSKEYKLYLSTGNSTDFAMKEMINGGIKDCFQIIQGSDIIQKSPEHTKIFESHSEDENFINNAIYFGDGINDRIIAKHYDIPFIHIGNEGIDEYEIDHICKLDSIIEIIKDKSQ